MSDARSKFQSSMQTAASGGRESHLILPPGRKMYKPEEGKRTIDILGYKVVTPMKGDNVWGVGEWAPYFNYAGHGQIGPDEQLVVCPRQTFGKPCCICDDVASLNRNPNAEDQVKRIRAKARQLYHVSSPSDEMVEVKTFDMSFFLFGKMLRSAYDLSESEAVVEFWHPGARGCSVIANWVSGNAPGMKFKEADAVNFVRRRRQYTGEQLKGELFDLGSALVLLGPKELHKLYYQGQGRGPAQASVPGGMADDLNDFADGVAAGGDSFEDGLGDDLEPIAPATEPAKPAAKKAAAKKADPAPVDDFDVAETTAEPAKPTATKRAAKKAEPDPVDDDVPFDDLDALPAKKTAPAAKAGKSVIDQDFD